MEQISTLIGYKQATYLQLKETNIEKIPFLIQ